MVATATTAAPAVPATAARTINLARTLLPLLLTAVEKHPEGFSIDAQTEKLLQPSDFGPDEYVVALKPFGHKFDHSVGPYFLTLGWWDTVVSKIIHTPNGLILGGWEDQDGNTYLDVSIRVIGRDAALLLGKLNDQKAIWHPAGNECIECV